MNAARTALLFGTAAGTTLAAMLSAGTPAHAQATCVNGDNYSACIVPEGTTVGDVSTFFEGSTVNIQGTVSNDVATDDGNSSVTNSGIVGGAVSTQGENSGVSNSGIVGGNITAFGENSGVSNSGGVGGLIFTLRANSPITNSGDVTGNLLSRGGNSSIVNSGNVGTFVGTEGANSGVFNSGDVRGLILTLRANSPVTNSGIVGGTVSTRGENSHVSNSGIVGGAVSTQGENSGVSNSGGVGGLIITESANSPITNSGDVTGNLLSRGDSSPIVNSGNVGTFVGTEGANSGVFNSGSVAQYLRAEGDNSSIVNAGSVGNGENSGFRLLDGIHLFGADASLTLLPGSVIQGVIVFDGTGTRTLNVGNGLSINNTLGFTGTPVEVVANGAVFAAGDDGAGPGTRVAVVDPTNLSTQDEQLADLTGGIASARENRLAGVRNGSGGAVTANGAFDSAAKSDPGHPFWIEGFGSYREQDADQPAVATDQWIGGVVIGADDLLQDNLRLGFLGGAAWGGVDADFDSQETDSRSFFVGTYASLLQAGLIFDLALTGGYSEFDQDRSVANNTAAGGLETATADFSGWFVSPELAVTKPTVLLGHRLEGSLALRYAGLFLDGYTESGTTAPLTVDDRDVHVGVARLQIAAPSETVYANGSAFRYRLKAGLEARTNFGGETIDGALLGQNISFNPGGENNSLGGFAGLSAEFDTGSGFVFTAGGEGLLETTGSYQLSGRAGVGLRF